MIVGAIRAAGADDEVRYVGERVAAVVATSSAVVKDTTQRVVVHYEATYAVTDTRDANPCEVCLAWPSDAPARASRTLTSGSRSTVEQKVPLADRVRRG